MSSASTYRRPSGFHPLSDTSTKLPVSTLCLATAWLMYISPLRSSAFSALSTMATLPCPIVVRTNFMSIAYWLCLSKVKTLSYSFCASISAAWASRIAFRRGKGFAPFFLGSTHKKFEVTKSLAHGKGAIKFGIRYSFCAHWLLNSWMIWSSVHMLPPTSSKMSSPSSGSVPKRSMIPSSSVMNVSNCFCHTITIVYFFTQVKLIANYFAISKPFRDEVNSFCIRHSLSHFSYSLICSWQFCIT